MKQKQHKENEKKQESGGWGGNRKKIYNILKKAYFLGYYEANNDKRKDVINIDSLIFKFVLELQEAEKRGYEKGWANAEKNTAKVIGKLNKLLKKV